MKNVSIKLAVLSIVTASIGITLSSCGGDETPTPEPTVVTADFTFVADELEVTFTDKSVNGSTYSWNFGDQGTSTDKNPTHTYTEGGTFTVTLTVTGEDGTTTDAVSKDVTVTAPIPVLTAGFTSNAAGLDVTFTNTSENAVSYVWDFGDQGTSTDASPTHTYALAGAYVVTLTVTGADSETKLFTSAEAVVGAGDVFDNFTGTDGDDNVEWNIEPAITLESGVDLNGEKVGKYTRSGTTGSQYDKVFIRPFADDVVWTEREVFSIDVYYPSTNTYVEDRATGITKNVELRLRKDKAEGTGSDSSDEIRLIKDVTVVDEWVTIEFDMSEAAHWSGNYVFDSSAPYTTLVMMLGRDGGLFEGEFYIKNFRRL